MIKWEEAMKILIFCAVLLGGMLSSTSVRAQADLDNVDEKFRHQIKEVMPEWKCKRGKPMSEGENILVQFCAFSDRTVMISVMPFRSAQEARQALQESRDTPQTKKRCAALVMRPMLGATGYLTSL
jgi:hypothetical protein